MIEKYFTQPKTIARLHAGLLGPHLSSIAEALDQARYSMATIRLHLRAADRFGAWLLKQKITLADLSNAIVDRYIQGLDRQRPASVPNGKLPNSALGLRRLIEVLQQTERPHPATAAKPQSSVEAWLADFDRHLDHVVGCADFDSPAILKFLDYVPHLIRHYLPFWIMSRRNRAFAVSHRI